MLLLCIYYLCDVADVDDFTLGAVFYYVYVFSDVTAIDQLSYYSAMFVDFVYFCVFL